MFARQLLGQNWSNSELESDFLIVRIVLSDSINKSLTYYLNNLFFFLVLFLVEIIVSEKQLCSFKQELPVTI